MAKKASKKSQKKSTEIYLELPSESMQDCAEILMKSGDEIVEHFSLESSQKHHNIYSSKSDVFLKLELIDSSTKTARIVFAGFNRGHNRGRISYKIMENLSED